MTRHIILCKPLRDGYINDYDPLVKMAVIHYQFESIHPFYDGNGRTGRILNVLYLILRGLLDLPILYHSSYIIRYKADYYRLFQEVRTRNQWENWLAYMIRGIHETAIDSVRMIRLIKDEMQRKKQLIRSQYKFYSQDLINTLFKHPYAKIDFVVRDLKVSRPTAANYLNTLAKDGILRKERMGNGNYYLNEELLEILS